MDEIRALKDPYYRRAQGETAPAHPSGEVGLTPLSEDELAAAAGAGSHGLATFGCCHQPGTGWTWTTPSVSPTVSAGCVMTVTVCH
ncbi:mersacidin/lichenicidin family type 2 lantibiotic [Streptomyces sp. NPDC059009]|uniref:mersacidin/lichenicidin family type 2 lantibiotic n=1 Tax=Streptomyces sp. NPDC059009 TaxID=3346694 RepID=UPI0036895E7D